MTRQSESFLPVWIGLSVLSGLIGALVTYFRLTHHNFYLAGQIGLKCFLLMYIIGWVIFRVYRYMETTGSDSKDEDRRGHSD